MTISTHDPFTLVDTLCESKHAAHDVGQESRRKYPQLGWCLRCGMSNGDVTMHSVAYSDGSDRHHSGMVPLCEACWEISTGLERIEYCRALFRCWLVGALDCAWSSNVAFREDHPHWQKIRSYLERCQPAEAAEIPSQTCTFTDMKKKWRGTWWKPWTWSRGWDVTYEFKVEPRPMPSSPSPKDAPQKMSRGDWWGPPEKWRYTV